MVFNLKENFDRGIFTVHRNHQLFAKEQSTENLVLQIKNVIDLVELVDLKKTINLQMRLKETTVMKILDANVTTKNVKIESALMLEEFA